MRAVPLVRRASSVPRAIDVPCGAGLPGGAVVPGTAAGATAVSERVDVPRATAVPVADWQAVAGGGSRRQRRRSAAPSVVAVRLRRHRRLGDVVGLHAVPARCARRGRV